MIEWHGPPIDVISLGCGDRAVLSEAALDALQAANFIYGAQHHLREISHITSRARKIIFPSPFAALRDMLQTNQGSKIVVLGSGDALFYGVGTWLRQSLMNENLRFHPNISSIQYCFHAIGLPWQQAEVVSLHGRPLSTLRRHIRHNHLIAVLTDQYANPITIAGELERQGYGQSRVWVCEAMGCQRQTLRRFVARELAHLDLVFDALNICIIDQQRANAVPVDTLPAFPGIPDTGFSTGSRPGYGMISKRETRLTILTLMSPENDEIAWDIGAGCGSVSVEWARWNHQGHIYAIEQSAARIEHVITNSERFGTCLNLTPICGEAPACCDALPDPDSVFVGGSGGGLDTILDYAWQRLKPAGKLVASAVTEASRVSLASFYENKPAHEWVTLQVEKKLPGCTTHRALRPVTIAKCIKP